MVDVQGHTVCGQSPHFWPLFTSHYISKAAASSIPQSLAVLLKLSFHCPHIPRAFPGLLLSLTSFTWTPRHTFLAVFSYLRGWYPIHPFSLGLLWRFCSMLSISLAPPLWVRKVNTQKAEVTCGAHAASCAVWRRCINTHLFCISPTLLALPPPFHAAISPQWAETTFSSNLIPIASALLSSHLGLLPVSRGTWKCPGANIGQFVEGQTSNQTGMGTNWMLLFLSSR